MLSIRSSNQGRRKRCARASVYARGAASNWTRRVVKWIMAESPSIAIFIEGSPQLPPPLLKELYGITGRSTVELSSAMIAGRNVYAAELFGNDHVEVAPRLEKTAAFCERNGLSFRVEEVYEGETSRIDAAAMRDILEASD